MTLSSQQAQICADNRIDFSGVSALFINTSLKRVSDESHTRLLFRVSGDMMERVGVDVEHVHILDYAIPPDVQPNMTEHGWDRDDWPMLWEKVKAADILVVGTPLWLGEESSICRVLIERLYGMSGLLNDKGQSIYYGKVAGSVITGNEDGVKHAAMTIGYALSHLGYMIPPQADCGWIGEAGPGSSYGDAQEDGSRVGFDNAFTRRNTTIMTWNLMHLARMLKAAGGYDNHGNDRNAWQAGCCFGLQNVVSADPPQGPPPQTRLQASCLMLYRQRFGSANVTSLVERVSRFTVLLKNADKRTRLVMDKVVAAIRALPQPARRSITFDRGSEFVLRPQLQAEIGTRTWFCDPSAPWQKGTVENTNRRARRWLPRDRKIGQLSDHDIREICDRLNATPRKCFGWKTPAEVFRTKMLEKMT